MSLTVEPVEGQSYGDRQWGYEVKKDGLTMAHVATGGTGPCWNIEGYILGGDMANDPPLHVCDLDGLIEVLTALRDSEAHKQQKERWG